MLTSGNRYRFLCVLVKFAKNNILKDYFLIVMDKEKTADYILKILIEANSEKVEKAIKGKRYVGSPVLLLHCLSYDYKSVKISSRKS